MWVGSVWDVGTHTFRLSSSSCPRRVLRVYVHMGPPSFSTPFCNGQKVYAVLGGTQWGAEFGSVFVVRDKGSGSKHMIPSIPEDMRGCPGIVIFEHIQQSHGGLWRLKQRWKLLIGQWLCKFQMINNGVKPKPKPGFAVSLTNTLFPSKYSSY